MAAEGSGDTQLDMQLYLSPLIAHVQLTPRCLLNNYRFSDLSVSVIPTKNSSHFHTEPGDTTIVLLEVVKVQRALLFLLYISPVRQPSCECVS